MSLFPLLSHNVVQPNNTTWLIELLRQQNQRNTANKLLTFFWQISPLVIGTLISRFGRENQFRWFCQKTSDSGGNCESEAAAASSCPAQNNGVVPITSRVKAAISFDVNIRRFLPAEIVAIRFERTAASLRDQQATACYLEYGPDPTVAV